MKQNIPQLLKDDNLISEQQYKFIKEKESDTSFSIYWELRVFLYLGVTLLSSGLGILVYENIDTIGHQTIVGLIAILCGLCFWYSIKHRIPFTFSKVESPTAVFDYILLLGCLLFLTFETYLQYQYHFFGEKYGLAVIIPTLIFFLVAYFFDHRGILGMAITGLAVWLGIAITPNHLFNDIFSYYEFKDIKLIISGIGLGILLCVIAWKSIEEDFKKHFDFTYLNFGAHFIFISSILGLMHFNYKFIYVIILAAATGFFILYAKKQQSFYFLLISVLYAYFAFTYLFILAVDHLNIEVETMLLYFILSCGAIIYFFLNYKKLLNSNK